MSVSDNGWPLIATLIPFSPSFSPFQFTMAKLNLTLLPLASCSLTYSRAEILRAGTSPSAFMPSNKLALTHKHGLYN